MPRRLRPILLLLASLLAAVLAGVPAGASASTAPAYTLNEQGYHVTVTRSAGGIPHILGKDFGSMGFGYGLAFAQDNLCVMANDYITVEGLRSKWFGPTATYEQQGNGITVDNLDSDIFFRDIEQRQVVQKLLAVKTGPGHLGSDITTAVQGYVDGYNRYLSNIGGPAGITDPACKGAAWVHPITTEDAYLRFYQLVELASGDVVIPGIAEAAPPVAGVVPTLPATLSAAQIQAIGDGLAKDGAGGHTLGAIGSNAVAVGSAGTRDHTHGLLLGNPHFPWSGTERFYQAQLEIPGKLNVEGASLFGVPLVLIGHNETLAWSHTVSTAYRFTPYQLTLAGPTTYLQDGTPTAMTSETVSVPMQDGTTVTHTLYRTRYGPMFDSLEGVPLSWTAAEGFTLADANADNFRIFNHFLQTDEATSVAQELQILKTYDGIPWVNTIAADSTGHALYADIGAVPHVTDAEAQQCNSALGVVTYLDLRLPILDGSRTACNWGTDPDSVEPGLFGGNEMPSLERADYVTNSNDSYWLANPAQPFPAFPEIIGDHDTARTLRTRIGLIMTKARIDGTDGLGPAGFTRQDMQDMVFNDRQYGAELVKDATVAMCRGFAGGLAPTSTGAPVAVGTACDVLAAWNGREDVDAKGAFLFREFWEKALAVTGGPWTTAFSDSDPVHTPNGLNTSNLQVQQAFGDALTTLANAKIAVDEPLGDVQYVKAADGSHIPLHGGPGDPDGDFDAIYQDPVTTPGVTSAGSSYVQVVTWHSNDTCPDVRTILTYSESSDPTDPHFDDQTKLFSQKQWLDDGYCAATAAAARTTAVTKKTTTTKKVAKASQPGGTLAYTGLAPALPVAALVLLGAAAGVRRRRMR